MSTTLFELFNETFLTGGLQVHEFLIKFDRLIIDGQGEGEKFLPSATIAESANFVQIISKGATPSHTNIALAIVKEKGDHFR